MVEMVIEQIVNALQLHLSQEVCDPEAGLSSLLVDNGFFPLVVGNQSVLWKE